MEHCILHQQYHISMSIKYTLTWNTSDLVTISPRIDTGVKIKSRNVNFPTRKYQQQPGCPAAIAGVCAAVTYFANSVTGSAVEASVQPCVTMTLLGGSLSNHALGQHS